MNKLLADITNELLSDEYANVKVTGLCADSRKVVAGDAFFAVSGLQADGADYIDDAIEKGAVAVFVEQYETNQFVQLRKGIPVVPVTSLGHKMSAMAGAYYDASLQDIDIVGVTGTNGKTTCTCLIARLISLLEARAGLIGTLGYGVVEHAQSDLQSTGYTTPDALQTQQCISELANRDCHVIAMEVSSHALSQHRVESVPFKTAVFTNLSRDHLDFHGDMAAYGGAKRRLFESEALQYAIINIDDSFGRELAAMDRPLKQQLTYARSNSSADIYAENIRYSLSGIEADLVTPWGRGVLKTALIGEFNLVNTMAAIAAVMLQGQDFEQVLQAAGRLQPVAGRMQLVGMPEAGADITVVIDYAHTPQALEAALLALRPHVENSLVCVFGCGGDRDRGKRTQMGAIAEACAERVILTSDNPRSEAPDAIVCDIRQGIKRVDRVYVELDRGGAIAHAVAHADAGDIVLVAGKGHEQFQEINDKKNPFSDYDVAYEALLKRCAA